MLGSKALRRAVIGGVLPLAAFALSLASPLALGEAAAEPAKPAASDPKRRAELPYKEGVELAKAGKNEAALGKFEESYSLAPTGASAFQIARMEHLLARHALALQHYREALRDGALATEQRRDAERAVEELKTKIGVLTFDVPDGATVMVDGNEVDPKGTLEVVPGLHVVKVKLAAEVKSVDVDAKPGSVAPIKVRFGDEASGPTPPPAAPPSAAESVPAASGWSGARIGVVAGLAAGAVALGVVSFVFYADAAEAVDESKALLGGGSCVGGSADACRRAADLKDDRDSAGTVSTVAFVGAAALGVGAVAAAIFWPKSAVAKSAGRPSGFAPIAGPSLVGLSYGARF